MNDAELMRELIEVFKRRLHEALFPDVDTKNARWKAAQREVDDGCRRERDRRKYGGD